MRGREIVRARTMQVRGLGDVCDSGASRGADGLLAEGLWEGGATRERRGRALVGRLREDGGRRVF